MNQHRPIWKRSSFAFPCNTLTPTAKGITRECRYSCHRAICLNQGLKVLGQRKMMMMARPRKKLPERSVDVTCAKCRFKLYRYKKGGKGSLVKCYKERIVEDFTGGSLECPGCGQEFARDTMVHGRPAFKMIGGKVVQK